MGTSFSATRRQFLHTAAIGSLASLVSSPRPVQAAADNKQRSLRLALASYTLRKFDLAQTLAMTQEVGLDAVCFKDFHLPLDATSEQIAEVVKKVQQAGIRLYAGGVIRMSNQQEIDQAFNYAKAAGMETIVGVPSPELLSSVQDKVQQYDIKVAIHNHGPGDKIYPTPDLAYERIKGLDRRIGLCHDIGHTVRYGKDPVALTRQCADRMLDVHIKDVTAASKEGTTVACGRGIIDLPAVLRVLQETNFAGYVAFEYEANAEQPLAGLAESVGYVRGVLDVL